MNIYMNQMPQIRQMNPNGMNNYSMNQINTTINDINVMKLCDEQKGKNNMINSMNRKMNFPNDE